MKTDTEDVTATLDAADWQIACRSNYHPRFGIGEARWAIWQVSCCDRRPDFGYICDGCKNYVLTTTTRARCRDCGATFAPLRKMILRVEPIR